MNIAVKVSNLKKTYFIGQNVVNALNDISFEIEKGDFVAITGESGSGKSTLLHILGTLDNPTSGDVLINNENPFSGNDHRISVFRNLHIGFVFQNNNLLPEFDALENIMIPALIAGKENQKIIRERAEELLKKVNLEKRKHHFPSQLSGGEQQRVAIARALINTPLLILADEPSGNLDSYNASGIHELFHRLNQDMRVTILMVTHNLEFAEKIPKRIHLKDGLILG